MLDQVAVIAGLEGLWAPALAFFIAAASPGPATLAVAGAAMAGGRRAGLALGFGLSVGLAFWGALTALGLGALVLGSPPALLALRLAAGAYLLWLAWRAAEAAWRGAAPAMETPPAARLMLKGLILNLSNPKAALAWAAVIAIGLPDGAGAADLAAITALCAGLGVAIYAGYALGFAAPPVRRAYLSARRWIEAAFAALFGLAGLRLIFARAEAP